MESKRLKPITEASYLTVENAWRYRAILHYFYQQHERLRQYLFPEEVYQHVKQNEYFSEYTEEQLQHDLKQLVEWKNLIPRQETGRVMTIDEFKRKKFRYQCTPYTVEIERMVEKLQLMGGTFGGSLETTLFERLVDALRRFASEAEGGQGGASLNQAWEDVYTYFRKIVQSASDYLGHLKSEKVEERMMTEAFLVYKDAFAEYLRNFILGLQHASYNIERELKGFSEQKFAIAAMQLADYYMSIPRMEEKVDAARVADRLHGQWQSLQEWFLGAVGRQSELAALENETTETIRRITRFAQRLGERQQTSRSRYYDYLHLANWFATALSIDEAHELSALLFGVSEVRHLLVEPCESDDMYGSPWQQPPAVVVVKPRVNTYREKSRPNAMADRSAEREETLRSYLAEKEAEQHLMASLVRDGRIVIAELPEVETFVRKTLLAWIGRCMVTTDRTAKIETGQLIRLRQCSKKTVALHCVDGELVMPDFVIEFVS